MPLCQRIAPAALLFLYLSLLGIFPWLYYSRVTPQAPGVALLPTDTFDDTFYLGLISDGMTHGFMTGNQNHPEHIKTPMVRPGWLEFVAGRTSSFMGLGIRQVYWLLTGACAVLSYLGWFLIGRRMGMGPALAACGSFLVLTLTIGPYAFRPVHPQLSLPLFLMFEISVAIWWTRKDRASLLGLMLALTVNLYSYPHFWTLALVQCFLLGCTLAFRRQWRVLGSLVFVAIGSMLISLPVWLNLRSAMAHPSYGDLMFRLGHDTSGAPLFSKTILVWIALLFILRRMPHHGWLMALALGTLVCTNLQVVSGHAASPSRWIWYVAKPFLLVCFLSAVRETLLKRGQWKGWAPAAILGLGVAGGAIALNLDIKENLRSNHTRYAERYGEMTGVLDWMKRNLPPDSVVAAPHMMSPNLRVYASLNAFNCAHGQAQLISQDEYSMRLNSQDYLQGMTLEDYTKALDTYLAHRTSLHYGSHFHRQAGGYENVPHEFRQRIINSYVHVLTMHQEGPWIPLFKFEAGWDWKPLNRCDYVVIEKADQDPVTLKPYSIFKPHRVPGKMIWEDTHYSVWQIN